MPNRIRLYSECHADTTLMSFLVGDKAVVDHVAGINEVSKALETNNNVSNRVIGVVDNDKRKPIYTKNFVAVSRENRIYYSSFNERNQYLLIIDKAIETFLLWNAAQVGISVQTYGFNDGPKKLGDQLKTPSIETDPDYLRLLTDLHARNAPGFVTLHQLLNDLITT